ncbi:hypothetical protein C8J57DRAFT_1484883 [Mycena rebaudengoi]|nr:hypothetical protein C8J57DRAFT_1484883 [Mycena rebaudengoi]
MSTWAGRRRAAGPLLLHPRAVARVVRVHILGLRHVRVVLRLGGVDFGVGFRGGRRRPGLHGAHHRLRDATHTPAAADFAQPRAHRPMPATIPPRRSAPTITPSTTPAAATRSPGPWSRRKGCAGCASSLPRRSPNPPRMRTGRSSSRSQYGAAVACAGGRWSPSRYQGAAQQAGVYQGGGQQQQWTPLMQCTTQQHQQQAHQQQHTAPTAYAATHVTPAPAARRPACMHDDAVDAPAPRVRGGRARAVDAATAAALCGLGAVESGGGEGGSVACPAGPLARPCAARAHAHPLAHAPLARPVRAGADAAPRRVCERRPAGGERVCQYINNPPYIPYLTLLREQVESKITVKKFGPQEA